MGRRLYEDEEMLDDVETNSYEGGSDDLLMDEGLEPTGNYKTFADLVEGDKLYVVSIEYGSHGLPVPMVKGVTITSAAKDSIYCKRKYDSVFIEEEIDFNWEDSHSEVDEYTNVEDEHYAADKEAAEYLAALLLRIDIRSRVEKYKDMIEGLLG